MGEGEEMKNNKYFVFGPLSGKVSAAIRSSRRKTLVGDSGLSPNAGQQT
jgi:hypothetical protein